MNKPDLLDIALAPLTLLERAKGWTRVGLLFVYFLTLLVVGVLGWRWMQVWNLPDIGEPFDVAAFLQVKVPDDRNAMVAYRDAAKRLISPNSGYAVTSPKVWTVLDWAAADPEVRRWVEDNRPAMDLWLAATARPDAMLDRSDRTMSGEDNRLLYDLIHFGTLATLEASRLQEAGDLVGAWRLLEAALRTSRHAGQHGGTMARMNGLRILSNLRPRMDAWLADSAITPELFRRAVLGIEACRLMTPPVSEMVKVEYLLRRASLDDLGWSRHHLRRINWGSDWHDRLAPLVEAERFVSNEPEKTRRVLQLITAGWLAQCDRPSTERARMISQNYAIFEIDSSTPSALASIAPLGLERAAKSSLYQLLGYDNPTSIFWIDSDAGHLDALVLRMAERGFTLEHGRPPQTYADLLGSYLQKLPYGLAASDAVNATTNP
jgi:hypothetical protein